MLAETTADAGGFFSFDDLDLGTGDRALRVVAYDRAGNESSASDALDVSVDRQPPAPPTRIELASSSDTGVLNNDRVTSVYEPLSFRVHLADDANAGDTVTLLQNNTELAKTTIGAGARQQGVVTLTLAAGTLSAADYDDLNARVTDASGNVGAKQVMPRFTVLDAPTIRGGITFDNGLDSEGRTLRSTTSRSGAGFTTVRMLSQSKSMTIWIPITRLVKRLSCRIPRPTGRSNTRASPTPMALAPSAR
jgi:hypothetical protein